MTDTDTSNEEEHAEAKSSILSAIAYGILWLLIPPLYAVIVLFRDFTFVGKVLRIGSTIFNPIMWYYAFLGGIVGVAGLFQGAVILSERDLAARQEMAETCSAEQLVTSNGTIECVPYQDVANCSDKIGSADTDFLQDLLDQPTVTTSQILAKQVLMTSVNSAWDSVREAVGIAYIVTDISVDSIVKDRSSTLETSWANDGSLGFGWLGVGNIFQELPLNTEQTDVVIQEAIVTAPNFPRMYNLENGTLSWISSKTTSSFQSDMWNIEYENCRLVDPSQRTIFNALEYGPKSFTVN